MNCAMRPVIPGASPHATSEVSESALISDSILGIAHGETSLPFSKNMPEVFIISHLQYACSALPCVLPSIELFPISRMLCLFCQFVLHGEMYPLFLQDKLHCGICELERLLQPPL